MHITYGRRLIQQGHYLLPAPQWTPAEWARAAAVMAADATYTAHLCDQGEKLAAALGDLQRRQAALAATLQAGAPPELRADDIRLLVTALRRAHHLEQSNELVTIFNTVPGRIA